MMPIRTILHPTDFSQSACHAFGIAATLAREHGARLVVLHVRQTWAPMVAYGDALVRLEPAGRQDKLWEVLHDFRVADACVQVEHRLVEGEPVKEILRAAEQSACDLIVMGTHGRTGLHRLVLGSVADRVLKKARCAVLTVRPSQCTEHEMPPASESDRIDVLSAVHR